MFRRRLSTAASTVTLTAAAFLGSAAAPARADLPWKACGEPQGYQCARAPVALDRSGAVGGAISLNVVRAPAASNPERSAVIALAGGPGQAAAPLAASFSTALAPALATRDLIVFDQRGTGQSNPLACGAFSSQTETSLTSTSSRCASQLGAGRAFFTTADSVKDIEDLRILAGYDKLVLYGVSYGTKVALSYAAAYPTRVERLVIDSVVTPEGPDALQRSTFAAVKRVLGELCANKACSGVTTSATVDLRKVVRQMQKAPLRGRFVTARGRVDGGTFDRDDLLGALIAGDLNPTLRAELPAALSSATRGDRWPLTRLIARLGGLTSLQADSDGVNSALYAATTCEELPFPWDRAANARTRQQQLTAALSALPSSAFLPFDRNTAGASSLLGLCRGWPTAGPGPPAPAVLPGVPTLVLNGTADLRTPLEDAQAVAARIPGAQVAAVPFTGHSVLGSEFSEEDCAKRAVQQFFGGQPVSPCTNADNAFDPVRRAPTSLGRTPDLAAVKGRRGRTIVAVLLTATDVRRQVLGTQFDLGRLPRSVGGLRGGRATVASSGAQTLSNVEYVPGVRVSGSVRASGSARLRVSGGGAASGSLVVNAAGTKITGRLGGRRVALASAASASLMSERTPSGSDVMRSWALRTAG